MQLTKSQTNRLAHYAIEHLINTLAIPGMKATPKPPSPKYKIKNLKKIKRVAKGMKRKPMTKAQKKAVGIRMRAYWAKRRKAA